MKLAVILVSALLFAAPALAGGTTVRLVNESSRTVDQMVLFHVAPDGTIIDDVIGGIFDPVAPGRSAEVHLNAPCQPTSVYVRLGGGRELSAVLDTCADRTVTVRD